MAQISRERVAELLGWQFYQEMGRWEKGVTLSIRLEFVYADDERHIVLGNKPIYLYRPLDLAGMPENVTEIERINIAIIAALDALNTALSAALDALDKE